MAARVVGRDSCFGLERLLMRIAGKVSQSGGLCDSTCMWFAQSWYREIDEPFGHPSCWPNWAILALVVSASY